MSQALMSTRTWRHGDWKFSLTLEEGFWDALEEIADARRETVLTLVQQVDAEQPDDLASALRVYVMTQFAAAQGHGRDRGQDDSQGRANAAPARPRLH